MKLCKNCRYYAAYNIAYCTRLIVTGNNDLVRGPSTKYDITCGPEAQFWKPSLKYRIIKLFKKNEDSTIK